MSAVLIADDDAGLRRLVCLTLGSDSYNLLEAGDGRQAWEMIEQHHPDLALIDVNMPGLTGLQLTEAIKADPGLKEMVVVLLTAKTAQSDVEAGFQAGADHYVTKPFSPWDLMALIEQSLDSR
ncbi:MAG: response regulator [Chloroflexi bacterium]|nr:response regulator [Chloroflexota bacterium]